MADDNSSFGQLVSGSEQGVTGPTNAGISQGIELAKTAQDMQQKQQESQLMQQKLTDMQFNDLTGRIKTQLSIQDPNIQKVIADQNEKQMKGKTYPGFWKNLHQSDEMQQGYSAAMDHIMDNPLSSDEKRAAIKMVLDPTASHGLQEMFLNKQKTDAAMALNQAKMSNARQMNENTVSGKIEAANIMGGTRKENMLRNEAKRFHDDSRIKSFSNQIDMIDNIKGILAQPNLTNQEFNDAQIEISNAIAGARGAALGKLERTEYDTLGQHMGDLAQKVTGNPQDSVPTAIKNKFNELVNLTQTSFLKHRSMRAKGLLRSSDNDEVMKTQHEAMLPYLYGDTEGHQNEVDAEGRDMNVNVKPKPAPAGSVMGPNAAFKPQGEQEKAAYDAAVAAGHNPAEVAKRIMQRRGGQ